MKQKLLNNFRLRATLFVAMLCAAFTGAWAETKTDVLNQLWTGVSGTNYKEVSNLEGSASDAVYKAQCAGGNSSIQLRSNSSNSGVVSTTSGGKVRSITVTWNSNTTSGRTLNVYGKSEAYSAASDLYNSSSQGTLLGTIVCGTSTKLEIESDYEYIGFRSASGAMYLNEVQIEWEVDGGGSSSVSTTTTIDASGITNTDVYAGTEAGALSATVSAGETIINNATITWSGNNDAVATIDASTGAVTLVAAGSVTFTATYAGVEDTYSPSSKTYVMTVTNSDPNVPGTENNPYTVAQAREAIDAGAGVTGVYATGIVSKIVTAYNSQYGNISYNISADGTETADQLLAYRGKSYNGGNFTSEDDIKVGDFVVVYGNLTKYNSTYEFAADNQLVSLDRPVVTTPTITVSSTSLTGFTYLVDNGPSAAQQITIGGENLTNSWSAHLNDYENSYFEFSFIENEGYSSDGSLGSMQEPNQNVLIYVRLKSGLAAGDYDGAITISSEGAETVTVNLSGSVTAPEAPNVTWNLATASYDEVTNENIVTWSSSYATMTNSSESGGTKASNYLGGDANNRTSSRFYSGNTLTITPGLGYMITSIEFEATSENYASVLGGSTWTNATASASKTTVTVTPTSGTSDISAVIGGTCGLTSAKVYYQVQAPSAPVWAELPTPEVPVGVEYELDLTDFVSGVPAPTISIETGGDIAQFENNVLSFTPTTAGEYVFTFRATNTEGSEEATLTVTVSAAAASIEVSETTINIKADETTSYVIVPVTYTSFTPKVAHAQLYEADGVTPLQSNPYTWITVGTSGTDFFYQINETNTSSEPRTVYCKIVANDADNSPVYSDLITITQAGVATDYATLPFSWVGGANADLQALNGVTANGLGSDYAAGNAPYLVKLDGTGDYIQVKTDSRPGVVTVGVKMLGGADTSTITVQESADGVTFSDVEVLTISGKQNDVLDLATTNAFAEDSRYVRLLFTKGSNVGVGPISISIPSNEPSITLPQYEYGVNADGGDAELPLTCKNLADEPQLEVVFVDADGTTPAQYDWISASINGNGNIAGHMEPNTGDARTAYFKVAGKDAEQNWIYSNLVTITQDAYTGPNITMSESSIDFTGDGGEKTLSYNYESLGSNPTFEVRFFESDGVTETQCSWIYYQFDANDNKVTITSLANDEGVARTAYFKVCSEVNKIPVYSNLVTVNQAAPVVDYATLPFSWDDTNTPNGITTSGVGTYKSSPYMKFDGSGDYIILKIDEVPGTLTFDVKGNSFSGGTFTVQTSVDGVDYDDLETYTELDATQSETFKLASSVRYIKWVYTEKVTGNVALGNIVVTAPMNLNLNAYGYATYASEYALDFTTAKAEGYSAWEMTEVNYSTGTITFNQIKDKVAAGTGVLLMGDPSSEVTLTRTANGEALPDNKLVGITESTQVGDNQYFGLKGNEFVKVNAGVVPAGKALLPIDNDNNPTAGVKSFTLIFNDADGIQTIETVSAEKAQAIFNLAGQRLPKAQKGINIINGKKVLVK